MYRLIYRLLFVLLATSGAYSQINVTIQGVPPSHNILMDEFPLMKINVRVTDGGNQVQLQKNQFYILEEAMVCEPFEVSPVINGWQTIKYFTKLNDFTKIGQENKDYFAQLLTVYNNTPDRRLLTGRIAELPYFVVFSGSNEQQIRDAYWANVTPGNSIPYQIKVRGYNLDTRTFKQSNIKIDSIRTQTPYFTYKWLGPLIGEKREPPAEIAIDIDYLINIFFTPDKFGYFQDIMTIYFNNGMTRHIPLYGNNFKVDVMNAIELTEPVPGQTFAPCEDVIIKWKGHDPAFPVELSYTTDAGYEWKKIDVVKDSVYRWIVPNIESNFVYLKVRQDFQNSKTEAIREDFFPVYSVNYNYNGTELASSNSMGKIMRWDLTTTGSPGFIRRQFIEKNEDDSPERFYSFGLEYGLEDNKIFLGYRNYLQPGFMLRDSIAVFDSENEFPVHKIPLPSGFRSNKIVADRQKSILSVFPQYGNKLLQYSMYDYRLIKEFAFDAPIMDIAFNSKSDTAAVLLINGRIKLVKLPELSIYDELNFDIFPNFLKIAFSPNGKMLSIGGQSDNSGLKTNSYLIDIATRQIVKVFSPSGGDAVSIQFNPNSTSVVLGSETDRQIAIYDLTSVQTGSNLFGHTDNMTDMKLSPNGLSIVSTSISNNDNIVYRTFTYPQEDQIDKYIFIERPKLSTDIVRLPDAYLGTQNTLTINSVCNIGRSMALIYDARFKNNTHFKLSTDWVRDTALSGKCFSINVNFNPLDTGIIRDTLILYHCIKQYLIPFEAYSIPRTITLLNNNFDFGEVCLGDTVIKDLPLFRNDDPVPLQVNYTMVKFREKVPFSLIGNMKDTLLQPGEVYIAKIRFVPVDIGASSGEIEIYYANQKKIVNIALVKGTGIGAYLELSHQNLRFIPEIPIREVRMKNIGAVDVFFEKFDIVPLGDFEVITPAGFNMKPGEEKSVQIRWNGTDETPAQLITYANPCLVQKYIPLTFYKGSSNVKIPKVEALANDENVRIPITYSNVENGSYDGIRIFEADFSVDYRIFFPRAIESKYENASITSNKVSNDKRTFGIKVEGNFAQNDTLATIIGVAGLSSIDKSPIEITTESVGWSKFVNLTVESGEIIITGLCEDRYVIRNTSKIKDLMVIPNPVSQMAKISFDMIEDAEVYLDLIDNTGCLYKLTDNIIAISGKNEIDVNLSNFNTGNYKLRINTSGEFITRNIIIIR